MADTKISALTDGGTIQTTDDIPVNRAGANRRVRVAGMALQAPGAVAITGGTIAGITDLALADGGTGASDAAGARTNLGLVIGTHVQAYASIHDAIAALAVNGLVARTASGAVAARTVTAGSGIGVTNGNGVVGDPTVALNITGLSQELEPHPDNDFGAIYDASATANKKARLRALGAHFQQTVTPTPNPSGSWQSDYYFFYGTAGITAAAAMTAQRENWLPVLWTSQLQSSGLGIYVGTGAGSSNLAMALYYRNADGSIGARIGRGETTSTASSAWAVVTWTGVDIEPGTPLWVGVYSDGTPSLNRVTMYLPHMLFPASSDGRQTMSMYRSSISLANAYPSTPPLISDLTASIGGNTLWCPCFRAT